MKTVVLHTHSPTIVKLQILCRSKDALKERKHWWKISCYFLLQWSRRKELLLSMNISWRKIYEANCRLDKPEKLSIFVFHSLAWKEEAVSLTSTHSSQQANAASEKNLVFLRKHWDWIILKDPWISRWMTISWAMNGHRSRKNLACCFPHSCQKKKEKTRMRIKYKHPRLVKSLGSHWDWSQGSSIGLFPLVFRDACVNPNNVLPLKHCKILLCADRREIFLWPHQVEFYLFALLIFCFV